MFQSNQQLPGIVSFLIRPLLQTLEVQLLQDPVFSGIMGRLFQGFLQEGHWWHPVGWSDLINNYFGGDYDGMGTQIPQTDWYLRRCLGVIPHM